MKHQRTRLVVTALALSASVTALAGCSANLGGQSAASAGKVTVSALTFETPAITPAFWDAAFARAEAQAPGVTVKRLVASGDRTTYAKQLAATNQFPDLTTAVPPEMVNQMMPFDKKWLAENYAYPEANTLDGKTTINPPAGAQVIPFVYYNKTLFDKIGAQVPKTWSEFEALIPKFEAAGIQPIELDGADSWAAPYALSGILSVDVLGSDPNWIQQRYKNKVKFTDANVVAAVEKYQALAKAGAFGSVVLSTDFPTANKNFTDGKAAMYFMGSWFSGKSYVNDAQSKDVGVFALPSASGKVVLPLNANASFSVYAKSPHATQAMQIAQAFMTDPKNYQVFVQDDGLVPLLKNYKLKDFGAKTTSLYDASYSMVQDKSAKVVSEFGLASNQDRFPPAVGDKFATFAQALLSNPDTDVKAQLAQLDQAWDAAPKQ
jgi:multiple sugar transport system substrate-binding protein/raffinose/stachyose/melibiose transport system substrate-binding protein